MPTIIIPEDPANEWDDADWNELIDTMKPGGADAMSHERSEAVLEAIVPANKARAAARRLMGYSLADSGTPWRLRRYETPFCHPRWPWLWCSDVGIELAHPKGNTDKPHPDYAGKFLPQDDAVDWVGYGPDLVGKYMWAKLTARFTEVNCPILPDGDANWSDSQPEYNRFVGLVEMAPRTEIVTAESAQDGGSFKFAETDDPTAAGSPTAGTTTFDGSVYVYKTEAAYTLVWKGVEESYCCAGNFIMPKPTRLLNALGKVNGTQFINSDFPKQTLLFDGLRGKRYQFPVRTNSTTGLWAWDWYLSLVFADPTRPTAVKDSAGNPIASGTRARGHQLRPWRGSRKWYYATRGANAGLYSGEPLLEETEFADIFKHVLAP